MADRNVEQLHSSGATTTRSWIDEYVKEVWNKPENHLVEIGIAGIAAAAFLPVGRMGLRALGERLPGASGASGESLMSARALKSSVDKVRSLSYELDSGFSSLVGKIGPNGERVIATADGNAFRLHPLKGTSTDPLYAHELVLPQSTDKFTARYLIDSQHTNSWSTVDAPAWPNGKTGIWTNLETAGVGVRPSANPGMKLEYTSDMNRLAITADERINITLDAALEGRAKTVGQIAVSNRAAGITIDGPSAVRNGHGVISIQDLESKVSRSLAYNYPEVLPGGTLRVYHDSAATIRPTLPNDVRHMSKINGLVPRA